DVLEYHVLMATSIDSTLEELGDQTGADLDAMSANAKDMKPEDAPNQVAAALRAMKIKLGKYRVIAVNNRTTVLATLLHPKHRLMLFEADYPSHATKARSILLAAVKELVTTPRGGGLASRSAAQLTSVHSPLKRAQQERMARVQERVAITSATTGDPHEEEVGSYLRNVQYSRRRARIFDCWMDDVVATGPDQR
ncbi:unnamed protein product, partial [Tilletia caries]